MLWPSHCIQGSLNVDAMKTLLSTALQIWSATTPCPISWIQKSLSATIPARRLPLDPIAVLGWTRCSQGKIPLHVQFEKEGIARTHVRRYADPENVGPDCCTLSNDERRPCSRLLPHCRLWHLPCGHRRRPSGNLTVYRIQNHGALLQTFATIDSHVHPKWTGQVDDGFDIAMLKLNREADLTSPQIDKKGTLLIQGDYLSAIGWGTTQKADIADVLQIAQRLVYIPQKTCERVLDLKLKEHMICAGMLDQDTCRGGCRRPIRIVSLR